MRFARFRIKAVEGIDMPDEELSRASRFDDRGWRIPRLSGRQCVPDFLAGVFVEGIRNAAFSADDANQFLAVDQRVPAKSPNRSFGFEITLEILVPEDRSFGG